MSARYIKTVDGFGILFEAQEEDMNMRHHFIRECGWTQDQFLKIEDYAWFCAKVSAWKDGDEIASEYLGACCYLTEEEFYTTQANAYFNDMVRTVVAEAKAVTAQQEGAKA